LPAGDAHTNPKFFAKPASLRAWLERNTASAAELWVGFHKKGTGRSSITWPESVDEALCFGWIDGIRKSVDSDSYAIRFTPRRAGSVWSARNIGRVEELIRSGRMTAAGLDAYSRRDEEKSRIYSFEQRNVELTDEMQRELRRNRKAWQFLESQPPSYRRAVNWWIMSAKRADTRDRRLATLIGDSAVGRRIQQMRREPND
jgi:uncharacterized protein YdeI (YjbR/CyaY-like superfamily)